MKNPNLWMSRSLFLSISNFVITGVLAPLSAQTPVAKFQEVRNVFLGSQQASYARPDDVITITATSVFVRLKNEVGKMNVLTPMVDSKLTAGALTMQGWKARSGQLMERVRGPITPFTEYGWTGGQAPIRQYMLLLDHPSNMLEVRTSILNHPDDTEMALIARSLAINAPVIAAAAEFPPLAPGVSIAAQKIVGLYDDINKIRAKRNALLVDLAWGIPTSGSATVRPGLHVLFACRPSNYSKLGKFLDDSALNYNQQIYHEGQPIWESLNQIGVPEFAYVVFRVDVQPWTVAFEMDHITRQMVGGTWRAKFQECAEHAKMVYKRNGRNTSGTDTRSDLQQSLQEKLSDAGANGAISFGREKHVKDVVDDLFAAAEELEVNHGSPDRQEFRTAKETLRSILGEYERRPLRDAVDKILPGDGSQGRGLLKNAVEGLRKVTP